MLDRQARRLGELLLRGLAAEFDLEPARGARELLLPLDDVHGDTDRARVIRDGALHRLADPPGGVGRELVAAAPVELLDRAVESERSLLDQIQERHAETAVALRDRHDQAQVRLDHAALRALVAALDRLREDDLLVGGQQLVTADVGEEELQAVGRAPDLVDLEVDLRLRRLPLLLVGERRPDIQADRLQLARQLLDLVVAEVVLQHERLEVDELDVAALLGVLDEGPGAFALEQIVKLILRQMRVSPFVRLVVCGETGNLRTVGAVSWLRQGTYFAPTWLPGPLFPCACRNFVSRG